jgi:hypothetical protein
MKTQYIPFAARVSNDYRWRFGPFKSILDGKQYNGAGITATGNRRRLVPLPDELFLEFSALASDDDIKNFVDRYGLLGVRPALSLFPQTEESDDARRAITAELRLEDWSRRIHQMKNAIQLWMAIKTEDTKLLTQLVHWAGPRHIEYKAPDRTIGSLTVPGDSETILLPEDHPELKKDDVIARSEICLERKVTENLMPYVQFALPRAQGSTHIKSFIRPTCAYGALWYQLAEDISAFKSFHGCDVCHKPIVVTPGGYRGDRRTCSANCRMKIYDARKLQARQLQQEKVPLHIIAKQLDTSVERIKRWTQAGLK